MKLIIIRGVVICVISRAHRIQGIHGVHSPTKIISTSACRVKHLILRKIVITTSKSYFCFHSIYKSSNNQGNKNIPPVSSRNVDSIKHHANYNQSQQMTPKKLQYFYRSVQSILQFMNRVNLHDNQQFYLINYRITQILLEIHKLNGVITTFPQYRSQNNNTFLNRK